MVELCEGLCGIPFRGVKPLVRMPRSEGEQSGITLDRYRGTDATRLSTMNPNECLVKSLVWSQISYEQEGLFA